MNQPADDQEYLCVGICMPDPDSGYCLGCGRPPAASPESSPQIVAEEVRPLPIGYGRKDRRPLHKR